MKCRARTADDVQKAYDNGMKEGINKTIDTVIILVAMYLADKRGWKESSIERCIRYIMRHSEEANEGRIRIEDIRRTLKEEYNIEIVWRE